MNNNWCFDCVMQLVRNGRSVVMRGEMVLTIPLQKDLVRVSTRHSDHDDAVIEDDKILLH